MWARSGLRRLLTMVGAVLASASLTACAGGPGFHVGGEFCASYPPPGDCREAPPPPVTGD